MKNVWQSELDHCWSWLAGKPELAGPWAVGVSGGADSLALVFLLQEWAKEKQADFTALTVQHGLRPEAEAEAQYVARLMKAHGIKHHILYWKGEKPVSGVESAARTARYELMYDWCRQNGVGALLIAHHKRDQAETFLMRLQRGSGVDGLSAMAPVSKWKNLYVVRPLLQDGSRNVCALIWKDGKFPGSKTLPTIVMIFCGLKSVKCFRHWRRISA